MRFLLSVAATSLALSAAALAAGGGGGGESVGTSSTPVDPSFAQAKVAIEARNYAAALPLLQQVVARDPQNADAYNLMGYATRKAGDANGSLRYYTTALQIDPKHLGAHEYIGEAYLVLARP